MAARTRAVFEVAEEAEEAEEVASSFFVWMLAFSLKSEADELDTGQGALISACETQVIRPPAEACDRFSPAYVVQSLLKRVKDHSDSVSFGVISIQGLINKHSRGGRTSGGGVPHTYRNPLE